MLMAHDLEERYQMRLKILQKPWPVALQENILGERSLKECPEEAEF
jgi:hypothetical protein